MWDRPCKIAQQIVQLDQILYAVAFLVTCTCMVVELSYFIQNDCLLHHNSYVLSNCHYDLFSEPPNSADATTHSDENFDKMLFTVYILEKNLMKLSNFDYDLIIYFGTVCPQQLTQPQD